eukprot:9972949-Lingulodinium_polyedra.AAC.1
MSCRGGRPLFCRASLWQHCLSRRGGLQPLLWRGHAARRAALGGATQQSADRCQVSKHSRALVAAVGAPRVPVGG